MTDLFGIDDANNNIVAHLDDDVLYEKDYWPGDLVELCDVIRAQMKREGVEDESAYRMMERVLLGMSFLCGGRNYYLPNGQRIRNALRDKRIYDEFNGRNQRELSRRYKLCEQKIYSVIRAQRNLHRNRAQPDLLH